MALVKNSLEKNLSKGLLDLYIEQSRKASSGSESEDPEEVCKRIADSMAKVIADAVDDYLKSADVIVNGSNIAVMAGNVACAVSQLNPAKLT